MKGDRNKRQRAWVYLVWALIFSVFNIPLVILIFMALGFRYPNPVNPQLGPGLLMVVQPIGVVSLYFLIRGVYFLAKMPIHHITKLIFVWLTILIYIAIPIFVVLAD
jgi:hypothetical protein